MRLQTREEERVATQIEKVIVDSDLLNIQHTLPRIGNGNLQIICSGCILFLYTLP